MVRKKKRSQWRKSHTSCSQDLSPWQLSPPASPRTNWNCLHVSIVFISWLKVIVPLNKITHSVWVPCLIRKDLKHKLTFHETAKTNTGNLECHRCLWTQLYLWDHAWVRHNTMENRNLLLCYFCPSGLWCHTVNPLTGITAALQYWANVMVSSHLSPLDLLTPEPVPGWHGQWWCVVCSCGHDKSGKCQDFWECLSAVKLHHRHLSDWYFNCFKILLSSLQITYAHRPWTRTAQRSALSELKAEESKHGWWYMAGLKRSEHPGLWSSALLTPGSYNSSSLSLVCHNTRA